MEFHSGPNLLVEALAYFGRRAGGFDGTWMLERLKARGVTDTAEIEGRAAPMAKLSAILDKALKVEAEVLRHLFASLPGLPHNTVGLYSRAFLLLYPLAAEEGDVEALARSRTPEKLAGDLAMMLDIGEEPELDTGEFSARVLAMNIPAESKVAILELLYRGDGVLHEAMALLDKAVKRLKREERLLQQCTEPFLREVRELGAEALLTKTSALHGAPGQILRPFLFGMDTLLASAGDRIYCGVLRLPLQTALDGTSGPEVEVYEAIKLLADQTRFEILCHLKNRDAYGQELAAKFGLSRNTIHHHMTKLLAAHLVKCTVDGNRVYYRSDDRNIARLLNRQRELLLPGKD